MALQIGLVGLPNVGKSTLFNALTRAGAAVASYPFTTISPNIGIVPIADSRLDRIAQIIQPERVVPTTLQVVDIAGLVKGASEGEGLGNQFLSHIRAVDAIALVVRCFEDENVAHVTPQLNPIEDIETIELELILSDLSVLERHLERTKTQSKGRPRDFEAESEALEEVLAALRAGRSVRQLALTPAQQDALQQVPLLTTKPALLVANVSENALPEGGELAERVRARAEAYGLEAVAVAAQLEMELTDLPADDAAEYLAAVGLATTGLERLVQAGYRLLDLVTFFTVTGGHEVRAWTLRRGQVALEAAGAIHSDMARGFIRAEVARYEDLDEAGAMSKARDAGKLRLEGRDYVVQDGDILHIRFAV